MFARKKGRKSYAKQITSTPYELKLMLSSLSFENLAV